MFCFADKFSSVAAALGPKRLIGHIDSIEDIARMAHIVSGYAPSYGDGALRSFENLEIQTGRRGFNVVCCHNSEILRVSNHTGGTHVRICKKIMNIPRLAKFSYYD